MSYTSSNRNVKDLKPNTQRAIELFMRECTKQGLNVLITETVRTQERQDYLLGAGRTSQQMQSYGVPKSFADKHARPNERQVTWTRKSNHMSGYAWDICKNVKGQEYSDNYFFEKAGKIAKELGIDWGGTWKEKDTPHFQVDKNWTAPKQDIDHWAYNDWKNLNDNGVHISEMRFDDKITRGEVFALLNRFLKSMK